MPEPRPEGDDLIARLGAALDGLAPPSVRTGARRIDSSDLDGLLPVERDALGAAGPRRRLEFATGRALLRSLIGEPVAILVLASGAPALPPGVLGSLAHDDEVAVAAASTDPALRAIGVDIERQGSLEPDEAAVVLRSDEASLDPRLAFTLKEAAYKAWSGLGGGFLEYHDVGLAVGKGSFVATVLSADTELPGRFTEVAGRWLALVVAC